MINKSLLIALVLTFALLLPVNAQVGPITTPAYFGDIDTLFQRHRHFERKLNNHNNDYKPYAKGKDQILGTIINDPRVNFSTYLGGNGYDCCNGIISDNDGNVVVVGYSGSTDLKVTPNCYQTQKKGGHDAMIGKFTPDGRAIWVTYFGGDSTDVATDVAIDKNNYIIIYGKTNSINLPVTDDAEQKANAGGIDCFLAKFTPDGQLSQCTYYGGGGTDGHNNDLGGSIKMCSDKESFVIAGATNSPTLRVTKGAYNDSLCYGIFSDAFVAKFTYDLKLAWGTYFGGCQSDGSGPLAIDKDDNIIIIGTTATGNKYLKGPKFPVTDDAFQKDTIGGVDLFISKFTKNGQLLYSTLYGGKGDDIPYDIITDNDNNIIICGWTRSFDFPITQDAYKDSLNPVLDRWLYTDGFILRFAQNGIRTYSSYFGGSKGEELYSIALGNDNSYWISGNTNSKDLPYDKDSFFNIITSGSSYILLVNFSPLNKLKKFMVYNEGFSYKINIDKKGNLLISGETASSDFYIKNAFQTDIGFVNPITPNDGILFSLDMTKTEIKENPNKNYLTIFPNPSSGKLNINLASSDIGKFRIMIFDILGNNIYTNEFYKLENEASFNIDLTGCGTGTYFYKIRGPNAVVSTGKIFIY